MRQQRDRLNNPNFSSTSQRSPSYPSYQAPAPQPPPQQPPFDPFTRPEQRRDPFMPTSFGGRRDSLNGNSRQTNNYTSKDVLQPAPQPPPSPFRSGASNSYSGDRSESLGDAGPPQQSLQHSTSLLNRHMPPPSSSPKQSPAPIYSSAITRDLLTSSSRPRESSAPVSNHRSGGPMSIQSMMASDTNPSSNPSTRSNPPALFGSYTQPPSPLHQRFGSKGDLESDPLPHTPSSRPDRPGHFPFDRPETSITSPPTAAGSQFQAPEPSGHEFSRLPQSFQHTSSDSNGDGLSPRYSQPTGIDAGGGVPGPIHFEGRQGPGSGENYGGGTFEKAVRDRSSSDLESKKAPLLSQQYPRPAHEPFSPVSGPLQPVRAPYQPRTQEYRDPLLNGGGARRDFEPHQASSHGSTLTFPEPSPSGNGIRDRVSFESGTRSSFEPSGLSNPAYYSSRAAELSPHGSARYGEIHNSKTPPIDAQLRKAIEESQRQYIPRFANEFGGRPDRSSPLPQAVQGAQSQPAGSGRDPGVKSEFGRMFSGLGSGVGSTPQPIPPTSNGAPTPTRRSPEGEGGEPETFGRRATQESSGLKPSGVGSRGGRRGGKRALLESGRRDSDSGDGKSTSATASGRGAKRNRYMQQATGHHHHHPQGPHHHHHHRKADDSTAAPVSRRGSNTPHNSCGLPTPGPASNNPNVPHHHHHHPVPNSVPHHHHHPPKANVEGRVKRPVITISTLPVLRSVSHLPRRHLGSQLYSPTISHPGPSIKTAETRPIPQTCLEPNLIPRFDRNQANSTYLIRVPRYYLSDAQREKICKSRRLWGTDVYTDDSDPLAAAFHSGWIRGAWAKDVDVTIVLGLDLLPSASTSLNGKANGNVDGGSNLENEPNGSGKTKSNVLTAPPPDGPLAPPLDRDLHLTLLLLPPLEKYADSVCYGIKSRSWGDNHDGISFKIHKVEWVDEGPTSRWEERGGGAKKRRLDLLNKCTFK